MQEVVWPHQAAVTHRREQQSSRHTQDTLTPTPAQHDGSQEQHGCCLDAGQGDGCGEFRRPQVEVERRGQKERREREKQGAGLLQREEELKKTHDQQRACVDDSREEPQSKEEEYRVSLLAPIIGICLKDVHYLSAGLVPTDVSGWACPLL